MKKQHYYFTIISDKEIEPKEILFAISEARPNWGKMSASYATPNMKLATMQARIDTLEAGIRRIVNGEYDNTRTILAAEKFARELLRGDK